MMKSCVAPLSYVFLFGKVVQAFPLGSPQTFLNFSKFVTSNARAAARRPELSLPRSPCASSSRHNPKTLNFNIQATASFAPIQPQFLSSSPIRRRLAMSGGALRRSGKSSTSDYARISRIMMTLTRPSTFVLRLSMWLTKIGLSSLSSSLPRRSGTPIRARSERLCPMLISARFGKHASEATVEAKTPGYHRVTAAPSSPRLLAAWRVEAPSSVSTPYFGLRW